MATARSYAKVNLFLYVTGKRPDGYHELSTLFSRIGIYDTVSVERADETVLTCSDPSIPTDGSNIVMKVLDILRADYGVTDQFAIHIEKQIPAGGGLGGGSSNGAVFLKLANEVAELGLTLQQMESIMARVGSDTVFFLHDVPMIGTGRGEILEPSPDFPKAGVLVVNPGIFISTPSVYKDENLRLTEPDKVPTMRHLRSVESLCEMMTNDLERPVFARYPAVEMLVRELEAAGADKAMLSGSGSTVFGVFSCDDRLAEAETHLRKQHPDMFVRKTTLV